MNKTIYLAGPLFSEAEQRWCKHIKYMLNRVSGLRVNWPMDAVDKLDLKGLTPKQTQRAIAECCKQGVASCDILVVLLDTIPTDDGTSFELGYLIGSLEAMGLKNGVVPVIGLRTDITRTYGDSKAPLNAMIGAHVNAICGSVEELVGVVTKTAYLLEPRC